MKVAATLGRELTLKSKIAGGSGPWQGARLLTGAELKHAAAGKEMRGLPITKDGGDPSRGLMTLLQWCWPFYDGTRCAAGT